LETSNLENQLKISNTKISELENKCFVLSGEIERLTQITLEKMNDIDSWKVRNGNLEKSSALRFEELTVQMEIQNKNEMERLMREMNAKFNEERVNFETQLKSVKKIIIDLETKQTLYQAERDRLVSQLDEKHKNIEVLNAKIGNLLKLKATELEDLRNAMDSERRILIEREMKDLNIKFSNERSSYEAKIRELKQKLNDLDNKVTFLTVELERVTVELDDKFREVNTWKTKYGQLEVNKQKEIEEIRIQFEALRKSSINAHDYQVRFSAERSAFDTQLMQLKQKISEQESRVEEITKENQKLFNALADKQKELESFRVKYNALEGGRQNEYDQIKKELEDYRAIVYESKEWNVKHDVEKNALETQISQLKQIIDNNKSELTKCYDLLNTRKSEYENIARLLNDSRQETGKCIKDYKNLESEHVLKNSKYDQLFKETEELAKARDMYKNQLEKNTMEIARKNKDLMDKIQEVDVLKLKYEEAIASVRI